MLDYLLSTAQAFEREHGVSPDIIYINPVHYEQLTRHSQELFAPGCKLSLGFRLVIVPASVLAHPCASLLCTRRDWPAGAALAGQGVNEVTESRRGGTLAVGL